jgi:hypothetical protein
VLNKDSIDQYQAEERTMMAFRMASSRMRTMDLLTIMSRDSISKPEKILQLKTELGEHFQVKSFDRARSMGQLVKMHLKQNLRRHFVLIQKSLGKTGD